MSDRRRQLENDVARALDCPSCGARPSDRCGSDGDSYRNGYLHAARLRKARAIITLVEDTLRDGD